MNSPYKSINQIETVHFSSCEGCETPCCDGKRFFLIPLILEDFVQVYQKFAIVFAKIEGEWRMLMLLAKENQACAYFVDGKCSIYNERPPGCQLYPLTPFYDEILIDTLCPAINEEQKGDFFASKEQINSGFYHKRLENFNEKRVKSEEYLQTLVDDMESVYVVNGIELFKYVGEKDDAFLQMHRESLKFL